MKDYYVYIMANRRNGTIYTGVTNDIIRRVYEHREGLCDGFTKKYGIKTLVWYEQTNDVQSAILREKNIKTWKREWKLNLIETLYPDWRDLYEEIAGCQPTLA